MPLVVILAVLDVQWHNEKSGLEIPERFCWEMHLEVNALQQFLREHIPLSKAMEVEVLEASTAGVKLSAPLAPNINHRQMVFGGSATALAILPAWALIYLRLEDEKLKRRVVIQHAS